MLFSTKTKAKLRMLLCRLSQVQLFLIRVHQWGLNNLLQPIPKRPRHKRIVKRNTRGNKGIVTVQVAGTHLTNMKKIGIAIIVIALIAYRTWHFEQLKSAHDGAFYLRLGNSKDSIQFLAIGILLLFCLNFQDRWSKWFVYIGSAFCFVLSIVMWYDFLPAYYSINSREFFTPFYSVMTVLCVVLTIYLICYILIKKQA